MPIFKKAFNRCVGTFILWLGLTTGGLASTYGTWQVHLDSDDRFFSTPETATAAVELENGNAVVVTVHPDEEYVHVMVGFFQGIPPEPVLHMYATKSDGTIHWIGLTAREVKAKRDQSSQRHFVSMSLPPSDIELLKSASDFAVSNGREALHFTMAGYEAALNRIQASASLKNDREAVAEELRVSWLKACREAAGHEYDSYNEGLWVAWGRIKPVKAVEACRNAMGSGAITPQTHYLLGRALDKAGDAEAVRELQHSTEGGYPIAHSHLGVLLEEGTYGPKDIDAARAMYRTGYELGDGSSGANLARLMIEHGDDDDRMVARTILQGAINRDYFPALKTMADYLAAGTFDGWADHKSARNFRARAADHGNAQAAYDLAGNYRDGVGGAVDMEQYKKLLRRAAELGHKQARKDLGLSD